MEVGIIPVLKENPVRKKKKMLGELTDDDLVLNRLKRFEVEVYNGIMNSVLNEFDKRFSKHGYLYKSLELRDPRNFKAIIHDELKNNQLEGILKFNLQSIFQNSNQNTPSLLESGPR